MAKAKIQAGAEIDTLTKGELLEAVSAHRASWVAEVARGDRYSGLRGAGTVASGVLSIGGDRDQDGTMGPRSGYVWSVRRLAVIGLAAGDRLTLYVNDDSPSNTVKPVLDQYQPFEPGELVLYPNDKLLVSGSNLVTTGIVTVTGQVRELPIGLAWRLAG